MIQRFFYLTLVGSWITLWVLPLTALSNDTMQSLMQFDAVNVVLEFDLVSYCVPNRNEQAKVAVPD